MSAGRHLDAALAAEADAYRALLAGEPAEEPLRRARDAYLASHAETGPASWGRILGALKMAILAGTGVEPIARQAVAETEAADSPASAYVRALALVALGEAPDVTAMAEAGGAFERTGRALAALAASDSAGYGGRPRRDRGRLRGPRPAPLRRRGGGHGAGARAAGRGARDRRPSGERARPLKHRCLMPMFHGLSGRGRRYTPGRPGAIAQLGERHAGSVEVDGSSPSSSITRVRREDSIRATDPRWWPWHPH